MSNPASKPATSALTILGPPVGGFLVDTLGWRVAFLVNVPLVAIGIGIAVWQVQESRNEAAPSRFDWLGALAVAVAVGGLAFGAIRGQQRARAVRGKRNEDSARNDA